MKEFGSSGILVSRIGLGLAALGRPGYINLGHDTDIGEDCRVTAMEEHTHEMLDLALGSGINYFDAARSYGKAEAFLGSWLEKRAPVRVVVGSKWGYYYTAAWKVDAYEHEVKDHSLKRLKMQWPESREFLDPYLKLYQIHSATFKTGILDNHEVLEALERIRTEGFIIGITVSGEEQAEVLDAALKIRISGKPLFGATQVTYNLLEQSTEEVLKKAYDQGLGILIKEALANGRLTDRNRKPAYFDTLHQIARKHETGEDAVAMAYVLKKPFVHTVLSGAVRKDHLRSNLKALDIDLTGDDLRELDSCRQGISSYWNERDKLEWN